MRKLAAGVLLFLLGCRGVIEEHDEAMDPDEDGAVVAIDCDSKDPYITYRLWYRDVDLDGFGDPATLVEYCEPPDTATAWVEDGTDCNDNDGYVSARRAGHLDGDSDGYGVGEALSVCDATTTLAVDSGDCDDVDPGVNPAALEVCGNATDDNCDALPDCDGLDGDVEITERGARVEGVSAEGL